MQNGNQVLRSMRERLGLTQRAFAKKAGLHPVYICQVETGVYLIGSKAIRRIKKAFGPEMKKQKITSDDLLRGFFPRPAA